MGAENLSTGGVGVASDDDEVYRTNGLIDEIREDDKVEFNLRSDDKGRKGYNAVNIKVIG